VANYNHRNYVRDHSPEVAKEYDFPLMCGTETKPMPKQGKAKTGSEQKLRGDC